MTTCTCQTCTCDCAGCQHEARLFALSDAAPGPLMIAFNLEDVATRYIAHRHHAGLVSHGLIAKAVDTRGGSGLTVIWRDPVPAADLQARIGNCLWLLEEILAGRRTAPQPGTVATCEAVH